MNDSTVCGLPLIDLPEGITPLSAVVVFKVLDEDGDPGYCTAATDGLLSVEAVGMLAYADTKLKKTWMKEGED